MKDIVWYRLLLVVVVALVVLKLGAYLVFGEGLLELLLGVAALAVVCAIVGFGADALLQRWHYRARFRDTVVVILILAIVLPHLIMSVRLSPIKREFHAAAAAGGVSWNAIHERNQVLRQWLFVPLFPYWRVGIGTETSCWAECYYLFCPPLAWLRVYPAPYDTKGMIGRDAINPNPSPPA